MLDQATRLRQMMRENKTTRVDNNMKIITVTSGKGGVGKSNFVANLAISLQRMGKRTVILDADFGFANIDVILNTVARNSFIDLVKKNMPINEVLTSGPEGVQFISGAYDVHKLQNVQDKEYENLISGFNQLAENADVLIIDTGGGLQNTALRFMSISDDIIVVTTPDPTAITDAYSLIKSLVAEEVYNVKKMKLHLITNMVDHHKESEEVFLRLNTAITRFLDIRINPLGYIPFDKHLRSSVKQQSPVTIAAPNSKASKSIHDIAVQIIETTGTNQEQKSIKSIVKSILGIRI